ncbi:MAG TPA: right-handed parallel beta-helix repeat-containing protein [Actinomycetes bacterium]
MRPLGRLTVVVLSLTAVLVGALPASAHEERPAQFPDGTGTVPTYRAFPAPDHLVVCGPDSAQRIAALPEDARVRNESLLPECGFSSIQDAVDAVRTKDSTIYVLPGVYTEDQYADYRPTGECAQLQSQTDRGFVGTLTDGLGNGSGSGDAVAISYADQLRCPHNLNMIAILGDRTPDDDSIACDSALCGLQLEGTGASPGDVLIDNKFRKLNAIRADRAGGIVFRNFTVQQAEFNSLYVIETDGFLVQQVVARANDEYGFLAFASDHGLFEHNEAYYNGDSGIYPGSASDINGSSTEFTPKRYAVEIRHNRLHDNTLGYSGTAGNSVWAHDNLIWHNATGIATDSVFPGHPGLPQDHARFSHNRIWANNENYYTRYVDTGVCDRPMKERGYLEGTVCPSVPVPVGTGVLIAGGNYDSVDNNRIYDNWRNGTMQFWVPAPLRDDYDPAHLYDTSHDDHYTDNTMGVTPDGKRQPNGLDFWWDDEGAGNCWEGNSSAYGAPTHNATLGLPTCASGGSAFTPGAPVKDSGFLTCTQYNRDHPPGCDWFDSPRSPDGREG